MHIRVCDVMMCQYLQNVMNAPDSDFPRVQPINEIRGEGSFVKRRITLMLWRACQWLMDECTQLCVSPAPRAETQGLLARDRESILRQGFDFKFSLKGPSQTFQRVFTLDTGPRLPLPSQPEYRAECRDQEGVAGGGAALRLNIHHNHRKLCSATEPVSSLVSLHCTKYTHIPPDLSLI